MEVYLLYFEIFNFPITSWLIIQGLIYLCINVNRFVSYLSPLVLFALNKANPNPKLTSPDQKH